MNVEWEKRELAGWRKDGETYKRFTHSFYSEGIRIYLIENGDAECNPRWVAGCHDFRINGSVLKNSLTFEEAKTETLRLVLSKVKALVYTIEKEINPPMTADRPRPEENLAESMMR